MKKPLASRFIFYSLLNVALVAIISWLKPEAAKDFVATWQLWRDSILAGMVCGLGIAILGVYILLNRIEFVSLAIAQGAGLGIFLAFWLGALTGYAVEAWHVPGLPGLGLPFLSGILMAACCALLFAWLKRYKSFSEGSLTALIYILCSGFILLVGDRIGQGKHEIDNLLYGNAVAVEWEDFEIVLVVTGLIAISHLLFRREFLYVSADPIFMKTKGMHTRRWRVLLYFLLTCGITAALRTLGALPVFALILIPAFIALRKAQSLAQTFWLAILLGSLLPGLSYYYSHVLDLPTGACMILVGSLYLLGNALEGLRKRFRN